MPFWYDACPFQALFTQSNKWFPEKDDMHSRRYLTPGKAFKCVLVIAFLHLCSKSALAQFPGSTSAVERSQTEARPEVSQVSVPASSAGALASSASPPAPSDTKAAAVAIESFPKTIKVLGGIGLPDMKGKETWDNSLLITPDSIIAEFADSMVPRMAIPVTELTQCIYGQAATRHVGTWVAVGVLVAPVALLGMLHKSRSHFVSLSWADAAGKQRGLYFQVKGDDFRRLLNTISYRAQIPILADPKDEHWLLTQGVVAQPLTKDPDVKD